MKINPTTLPIIAVVLASVAVSSAATVATNTGSLGAAGNGSTTDGADLNKPGAVSAGGDLAIGYGGGNRTTVEYNAALNPAASSPFTVEFWAMPTAAVDDNVGPSPAFNRPFTTNRSGWVFFQRSPSTGWNLRMFDGAGSGVGWDLTGGTNAPDTWSHVVATWDGTVAQLYVNGNLADDTNAAGRSGGYAGNTAATISLGSYSEGSNAFSGSVDEFALYNTVLTDAQINNHFLLATSPVVGAYANAVINDGAVEYLQHVPEPASAAFLALGGLVFAGRRKRQA